MWKKNNYKRLIRARKGVEKRVNKVGCVLITAQKYCDMRDRRFKEYKQILADFIGDNNNE